MMSKRNIALFFLLLLQLIIIGYIYRPGKDAALPQKVFLTGITPDQVAGMQISEKDGEALALARAENGWRIVSSDNIPADPAKVSSILDKLAGLQSDRLVTRTRSSHQRLQVGKQYRQKVSLTLTDGRVAGLILGTAPDHNSIHLRAEEEPEVYLVKGISAWELSTDPASWWQGLYLDIGRERIEALTLKNRHGEIELVKKSEAGWQVVDQPEPTLDQGAVQTLLDEVRRISVSEYLGREKLPAFGLDRPEATLILKTEKETIEVTLGPQDEETATRVLKSSHSHFYVRVGEFGIEPLLERQLSDLREEREGPPAGE